MRYVCYCLTMDVDCAHDNLGAFFFFYCGAASDLIELQMTHLPHQQTDYRKQSTRLSMTIL